MKVLFPIAMLLLLTTAEAQTTKVLLRGHAHNDYLHTRPLAEALEQGFISVEADVHYKAGQLLVAHETPVDSIPVKTLEELYLLPLKKHIEKNGGRVYSGYTEFFYLMIDIKTSAEPAYSALIEVLKKYESIIATVKKGKEEKHKPVKIFITGYQGRPYQQVIRDRAQWAGLDGRPVELGKGFSAALMPVISDDYKKFFSWKGAGPLPAEQQQRLKTLVDNAHAEGKKVRLWASPDNEAVWGMLLDSGVDLVNTDRLDQLHKFIDTHTKHN